MSFIMPKDKSSEIHIGDSIIKSGDYEKLLESKLDLNLVKKLTKIC